MIENNLMTQDERGLAKYNEVVSFIETNHRNQSKYDDEEREAASLLDYA